MVGLREVGNGKLSIFGDEADELSRGEVGRLPHECPRLLELLRLRPVEVGDAGHLGRLRDGDHPVPNGALSDTGRWREHRDGA